VLFFSCFFEIFDNWVRRKGRMALKENFLWRKCVTTRGKLDYPFSLIIFADFNIIILFFLFFKTHQSYNHRKNYVISFGLNKTHLKVLFPYIFRYLKKTLETHELIVGIKNFFTKDAYRRIPHSSTIQCGRSKYFGLLAAKIKRKQC